MSSIYFLPTPPWVMKSFLNSPYSLSIQDHCGFSNNMPSIENIVEHICITHCPLFLRWDVSSGQTLVKWWWWSWRWWLLSSCWWCWYSCCSTCSVRWLAREGQVSIGVLPESGLEIAYHINIFQLVLFYIVQKGWNQTHVKKKVIANS